MSNETWQERFNDEFASVYNEQRIGDCDTYEDITNDILIFIQTEIEAAEKREREE